jgi:hypothetical protein
VEEVVLKGEGVFLLVFLRRASGLVLLVVFNNRREYIHDRNLFFFSCS